MLLRIDLEDPGTLATLQQCGQAITELNRAELIAMVEPFMSSRFDGKIVNDLSPDAVIKSVHIAQGLGASSAYTWMKLPVVHEVERVVCVRPGLFQGQGEPIEHRPTWRRCEAISAGRVGHRHRSDIRKPWPVR